MLFESQSTTEQGSDSGHYCETA